MAAKHGLRNWIVAGGVALAVGAAAARLAAPSVIRYGLVTMLSKECPRCRFRLAGLKFGLLDGWAEGRGIEAIGDPHDSTRFAIRADRVRVQFRPSSLIQRTPWITRLRIDGASVTVGETAGGPPSTHRPLYPWLSRLPALQIDETAIRGSRFTYEMTQKNGDRAFVAFHSVDADVGPFGTRQDLSPDRVRLAATAGQGGDAKIRIQASIGLFNQKKIDDIDIVIRNQALANLNTFLVPDDGIELSGFLRSANISIRVRKEQLSEQMVLDYDGLKVKYLADHERNGVVALFKSALSSALLHKEKSADGSQGAPAVEFKLAQEPTYGIFKFLLQGLTEGAQMVAKQG